MPRPIQDTMHLPTESKNKNLKIENPTEWLSVTSKGRRKKERIKSASVMAH